MGGWGGLDDDCASHSHEKRIPLSRCSNDAYHVLMLATCGGLARTILFVDELRVQLSCQRDVAGLLDLLDIRVDGDVLGWVRIQIVRE